MIKYANKPTARTAPSMPTWQPFSLKLLQRKKHPPRDSKKENGEPDKQEVHILLR